MGPATVAAAAPTTVLFATELKLTLVLNAYGVLCTVYVMVTAAAVTVATDRGAPGTLTVTTVAGGERVVVMMAPRVVVIRLVLVDVVLLSFP